MHVQKLFYYQYTPASAAVFDYGRYFDPVPGYGAIQTVGSSTTVSFNPASALDAYKRPFNDFSVGTIFGVRAQGGASVDLNRVATVTNDQNVVIGTAKDYSTPTAAWWYQKFVSGTTTADGWLFVGDLRTKMVKFVVTALGSTSIGYSIEMKQYEQDQNPAQILASTISAIAFPAGTATIQVPETCGFMRVGLRSPGGPNAADRVNVYLTGNPGVIEAAN